MKKDMLSLFPTVHKNSDQTLICICFDASVFKSEFNNSIDFEISKEDFKSSSVNKSISLGSEGDTEDVGIELEGCNDLDYFDDFAVTFDYFQILSNKTKPTKKNFSSIAFVVNPNAGKGSCGKIFEKEIQPLLNKWDNMKIIIEKTQGPNEANLIAKNFSNNGFEVIISVGGDGTNNEVLNGILNSNKKPILGFLPLGRGGDFSKSINMYSISHLEQLNTLKEGYCIDCDIGNVTSTFKGMNEMKSRYFLNESSFGVSGAIMKAVNNSSVLINSDFTYFFHSVFTSFFTYKNANIKYSLKKNDKEIVKDKDMKLYLASISNGEYFGSGMHVAPKAYLNDGLFEIILGDDVNKMEIIDLSNSIYTGDHLLNPKMSSSQCTEMNITKCEGDVSIECDGELHGQLPANFKILPQHIQIIVPKNL
eukprot:gene10547-3066_t